MTAHRRVIEYKRSTDADDAASFEAVDITYQPDRHEGYPEISIAPAEFV